MSVGKSINNVEVSLQYPVLGPLFLLFFLVIVLFVLISAFAAILVDAYGEIREEQGETGFFNAELGKYMYNVCIKKIKELPDKISCGKKNLLYQTVELLKRMAPLLSVFASTIKTPLMLVQAGRVTLRMAKKFQ